MYVGEDEQLFVEFCITHFGAVRDEISEKIIALDQQIVEQKRGMGRIANIAWTRKQRKRLSRKRSDLIRMEGERESLVQQRGVIPAQGEEYRVQWHDMCCTPRAEQLFFRGKSLVIMTLPLFGKDDSRIWHRIGPFLITIPLLAEGHDAIRWLNLDGGVAQMQGAAGIKLDGSVGCAGNAAIAFREAFSRHDHITLVEIAIRYAECTGQSDNLTKWPKVEVSEVPQWYLDTFGE
jgi:hypothetical protein